MANQLQLNLPQLPVSFMNQDHEHARELLETMVRLVSAPESDAAELGRACRVFYEHNRDHFGREEAAMQATGFPPYAVHKTEHGNALNWLDDLAGQAERGPASDALRHAIVEELPAW
jgi:hemerythrin